MQACNGVRLVLSILHLHLLQEFEDALVAQAPFDERRQEVRVHAPRCFVVQQGRALEVTQVTKR